jgi:hypothetical protein
MAYNVEASLFSLPLESIGFGENDEILLLMGSSPDLINDEMDDDVLSTIDDIDAFHLYRQHDQAEDSEDEMGFPQERSPSPFTPPHSPVPNEISIFSDTSVHRISPQQTTNPVLTSSCCELQLQYKRTIKSLTKSMRRSDQTRTIVKRQRSSFSIGSALSSSDDEPSEDFFYSDRCAQVEDSRRHLLRLLAGGGNV